MEKVARAFGIMLSDPQVNRILVNVFGGILRCDIAAEGIVRACKEKGGWASHTGAYAGHQC